MRRKNKKETLEGITEKMLYGAYETSMQGIIQFAEQARKDYMVVGTHNFETAACQELLQSIDWLFGYEMELKDTFEYLLSKMEKKVTSKDSSHSTIMSAVAYYCILFDILNPENEMMWDEKMVGFEKNKKLEECMEVLKRHCPEKIDAQGFADARRYIRLWDSEFNW